MSRAPAGPGRWLEMARGLLPSALVASALLPTTLLASWSRSRGPASEPCYQPDHGSLLFSGSAGQAGDDLAARRVDAVAVPAVRDPANLMEAAKVARVAGRMLIVLCSKDCRRDDVRLHLGAFDPQVPVLIVDLEGYTFPHRSRTLEQAVGWGTDTAVKRNAALLLARMLGLRHVLFLDDDVRRVDTGQLQREVSLLETGTHRAAGWKFLNFPDNSAVSHAYRRLRNPPYGRQSCFIGGGGLLVRIDDEVPHFPLGIYNEDWFFLVPLLMHGQVKHLGSLNQLAYDPFRTPEHALAQEFGDLIAEGLLSLLARRHGRREADIVGEYSSLSFWQSQLHRRRAFLAELLELLGKQNDERSAATPGARRQPANSAGKAGDVPEAPADQERRALDAVRAAAEAAARIRPRQLHAWVLAWLEDERCWRALWMRTGAGGRPAPPADWSSAAIEEALAGGLVEVGLSETKVRLLWPTRPVLASPLPRKSAVVAGSGSPESTFTDIEFSFTTALAEAFRPEKTQRTSLARLGVRKRSEGSDRADEPDLVLEH